MKLLVKNPYAPGNDIPLEMPGKCTVLELKEVLSRECDSHPGIENQYIVLNGRLLRDDLCLQKFANQGNVPVIIHLIVKGDEFRAESIRSFPIYSAPYFSSSSQGSLSGPTLYPYMGFSMAPVQSPYAPSDPFNAVRCTGAVELENNDVATREQPDSNAERKEAAAVEPQPQRGWLQRYVNFQLAGKLLVLIFLFGQDGDSRRLFMLCFAAIITYIHHMGILYRALGFRRGGNAARDRNVGDAIDDQNPVPNRNRSQEIQLQSLSYLTCIERFATIDL